MTDTIDATQDVITLADVQALAGAVAPCITVVCPFQPRRSYRQT